MTPLAVTIRLRNFAARPLVRNILKVLTGNIGGNALFAVTMTWLGLALGPDGYGVFTKLQNFMLLFAQLSDFGLNTTILKYYRDYTESGRTQDAEAIMRYSLRLRMILIGVIVAGCMLFASPISIHSLKEPGAINLFRLACLGALGASLWAFCQAAMQARQQFGLYALLTTANHALRLLLVWIMIHLGHMNVPAAILITIVVPFLGIVSSARLWPRAFWTARMEQPALRQQMMTIFHFSKWIFFSTIITTIIMRLDVLLLTQFSTNGEIGQFGMAMTLAYCIPLITAAVSTVLLPKLAATRRRSEIKRITGIFVKATPVLIVMIACIIFLAHLVIPMLKGGAKYIPALPVFDVLIIGFSLSVILNPISFFCLALDRARWLTWMNLAQLFLCAGLSLLLIPRYGALGAGISILVVRIFALAFLGLAYRQMLKIAEPDEPRQAPHPSAVS